MGHLEGNQGHQLSFIQQHQQRGTNPQKSLSRKVLEIKSVEIRNQDHFNGSPVPQAGTDLIHKLIKSRVLLSGQGGQLLVLQEQPEGSEGNGQGTTGQNLLKEVVTRPEQGDISPD